VPGETRTPFRAWLLVVGAITALCGVLPAAVAADSASTLRARASQLSQQNADLAGRSRSALLDLYALDSRLARARAQLVSLRIRTAETRAARQAAQQRLAIARRVLTGAQLALAQRLQQLYEQGDSDSLAVLLGASSVDEALNKLDLLDRVADQDRLVIEQTRKARRTLVAVRHSLANHERELQRLAEEAAQSTLALEQSRAERASYLSRLSTRRKLNSSAISSLEQQAQAVQNRTRQLAAVPTSGATVAGTGGSSSVGLSGDTLTVAATGYSLSGHTATGAPVGWGVVAVDPSVIPLGTRLMIPGYGTGVAADIGSAIRGATIDLWFPTLAQAAAWGRRSVTIILG
jgi:peptidoglycan DL-endopeptidase CwlO